LFSSLIDILITQSESFAEKFQILNFIAQTLTRLKGERLNSSESERERQRRREGGRKSEGGRKRKTEEGRKRERKKERRERERKKEEREKERELVFQNVNSVSHPLF